MKEIADRINDLERAVKEHSAQLKEHRAHIRALEPKEQKEYPAAEKKKEK